MLRMDVSGDPFPETQTPVFMAQMKHVVFRPYWDVPDSIVQREMPPQIRAKPAFSHEESPGAGQRQEG